MYNYGVNNIFYTNDNGKNWLKKDGNLPDLPVYNILQSPLDEDEVIIGTELGVWFTIILVQKIHHGNKLTLV